MIALVNLKYKAELDKLLGEECLTTVGDVPVDDKWTNISAYRRSKDEEALDTVQRHQRSA